MKAKFDRRSFLRVAGTSFGIGALYSVFPALTRSAGAEGIGLLRTELAFLHARDWPTEAEHSAALASILAGLGDRPAVVRVLDFGADKSPPFLNDVPQRGIELLLAHPEAFDFVWGNLPAASRADFNRHLADCRYCQGVVEEYSDIGQIIRNLPPHVEPPADLVAALRMLAVAAAASADALAKAAP